MQKINDLYAVNMFLGGLLEICGNCSELLRVPKFLVF